MITREEYVKALELVDKYHHQLNTEIRNSFFKYQKKLSVEYVDSVSGKTRISEWFANLPKKPSGRLCNLLLKKDGNNVNGGKPFEYVEDVNEFEFMQIRNSGEKCWKEFLELRELWIKKLKTVE